MRRAQETGYSQKPRLAYDWNLAAGDRVLPMQKDAHLNSGAHQGRQFFPPQALAEGGRSRRPGAALVPPFR